MLSQSGDTQASIPSVADDSRPIVFVVEDDCSMRDSLESLIEFAGWRPQSFASGYAFLNHKHVRRAGCLVLDYTLPDLNGLQIQERIAAERPDLSVIFITGHGDVATTVKAMKAGAVEFLTKPFGSDVLLGAIRKAMQRSRAVLRREDQVRAIEAHYLSLTARERSVMELVVSGLLNKQVALELGVTEGTVKAHRGRMMRKMQAASLPELVKMVAIWRDGSCAGDSSPQVRRYERRSPTVSTTRHREW
jgi:FixJ family two-component response regulator